jgi:hypothetical protein
VVTSMTLYEAQQLRECQVVRHIEKGEMGMFMGLVPIRDEGIANTTRMVVCRVQYTPYDVRLIHLGWLEAA